MNKRIDRSQLLADLKANTDTAATESKPKPPIVTEVKPKQSDSFISNQRDSALAMTKKRPTKQLFHDPTRIRMWEGHNRDYRALSAENCSDLIEAFGRGSGGQRFAAIVRKVEGSEDYDFEVICGARRHWTASYREMDLLIEIRDLSDREAFTLQDLENRDRKDVSDLERAIDYKRALKQYFDNDLTGFSNYLKYDASNLVKLMYLAELPDEITRVYSDIGDIKAHHGVALKPMLEDPTTRRRLMARAREAQERELSGKEVFRHLCKTKLSATPVKNYQVGSVVLAKRTSKTVQLNFGLKKNMTESDVVKIEEDMIKMIRSIFNEQEETTV